jgi:hypothetical protein
MLRSIIWFCRFQRVELNRPGWVMTKIVLIASLHHFCWQVIRFEDKLCTLNYMAHWLLFVDLYTWRYHHYALNDLLSLEAKYVAVFRVWGVPPPLGVGAFSFALQFIWHWLLAFCLKKKEKVWKLNHVKIEVRWGLRKAWENAGTPSWPPCPAPVLWLEGRGVPGFNHWPDMSFESMNGENPPTASYRWIGWVSEIAGWSAGCQETYQSFRGIYGIYLNSIKKSPGHFMHFSGYSLHLESATTSRRNLKMRTGTDHVALSSVSLMLSEESPRQQFRNLQCGTVNDNVTDFDNCTTPGYCRRQTLYFMDFYWFLHELQKAWSPARSWRQNKTLLYMHLEAGPIPLMADCIKFQPLLGWRPASTTHYNKIMTGANFLICEGLRVKKPGRFNKSSII